jgi:hypothetical protein
VYRVAHFQVMYIPHGSVARTTANLKGIDGTMSLYQFVGVPGQQRSAEQQPGRRGRVAAPHIAHHLHVRIASCYCPQCRVGQQGTCTVMLAGFEALVGQLKPACVRETLPAIAPPPAASSAPPTLAAAVPSLP